MTMDENNVLAIKQKLISILVPRWINNPKHIEIIKFSSPNKKVSTTGLIIRHFF